MSWTKVAEERHIPTLGMTRSHRGNITLPCWECDAPTMGMIAKWRTFDLTVEGRLHLGNENKSRLILHVTRFALPLSWRSKVLRSEILK